MSDSPILHIYHITTFDYGFEFLAFIMCSSNYIPLNDSRQLIALIVSLFIIVQVVILHYNQEATTGESFLYLDKL